MEGLPWSLSKSPLLSLLFLILTLCRNTQREGIWAWDCHIKELVLVFPVVLAMLGDNPMQSEIVCHISMTGKYFCRACWVKGSDALDNDDQEDKALDYKGSRPTSPITCTTTPVFGTT